VSLPPAAGALAGQVTLAAGSLLLQVAAARALGAEGLGTYALLFGTIVIATAVSTGLVGDSLTVLDRGDPALRAALALLALVTVATATALAVLVASPALTAAEATLFGVATAAFMAADLARRLVMAAQRFWVLVLADATGLTAAALTLVLCWSLADPALGHLLAALAVSQGVALVVAVSRLPDAERARVRLRDCTRAALRTVAGFGGWRAVQQFVRPTMLNAARWLVLVAAGQAAVGELEAARVFVAPAMILVQGVGSYLFASYAADRALPMAALRARADRAAAVMVVGAALAGAAAIGLLPLIGPVVTGDAFELSPLAVLGWTMYAASCAAVLPYGSLAAVRGRQAAVLGLRVADSLASLALAALVVPVAGGDPALVPWLLSVGSFLGGLLCRQVLLRGPAASPAGARETVGAQR